MDVHDGVNDGDESGDDAHVLLWMGGEADEDDDVFESGSKGESRGSRFYSPR